MFVRMGNTERPPVYYSQYLQLEKILGAQQPESAKDDLQADDEMLFIIIHQTYELWFKQILHELDIIKRIFRQDPIPTNSPDVYNSVHRIHRICRILDVAVIQMSVLETMTPLDFLDFRDLLRPASGFQSVQFKMIEASLGLSFNQRFGQGYYRSQLSEADIDRVKQTEDDASLLILIDRWLARMPFVHGDSDQELGEWFWQQYRAAYAASLQQAELTNLETFDAIFMSAENYAPERRFSLDANRSALFIMLYRDYPLLHLPYELLSSLLEIDELLSLWRHRHIHMVQRTIGKRVGTGGSSGADYLRKAADSHYIFKELAELTSFLLPRNLLPKLPPTLVSRLGYS